MDGIDDQATLDVDVAVDGSQADPGNSGDPNAQPEPFLAVNDRTKYATKEDAIKAFDESGKRIAGLSAWEKTAKQYGLGEPKHLETIFNETLELRKMKAEYEALKKMQDTLKAAKPTTDPSDPKAKEAQEVKEYLKNLGYTSKEDVDAMVKELRDELGQLKQSGSQAEDTRLENQVVEAREKLNGFMAAEKITDDADGTKANIVETLITNWVNQDDERVAMWSRGGVGAAKLVKEGFDKVIANLGWKAQAAAQPNASAAQAANVGRRMANSKTLPAQGTARNGSASNQPAPKKGINSDTHNKAWAMLEKMQANA